MENVICPLCGTMNKGVNLEETNGWMECEHCHQKVGIMSKMKLVKVPMLNAERLKALSKTAPTAAEMFANQRAKMN